MSQNIIPSSLELLATISKQIDSINDIVLPTSSYFLIFKKATKEEQTFNQDSLFIKSEICITYLQILLLLAASMHGGILIPAIKSFTCKNKTVRIIWDSGVKDKFTFGKFDDSFLTFFQYYQRKILSKPKASKEIQTSIVKIIYQVLKSYIDILNSTNKRVSMLLTDKNKLSILLNETLNQELLFILMSSLPNDQLNALFLHVFQFLPEELSLTSKNGHKISIASLFQTPSSDIHYLIEKVIAYFELYYSSTMPIIQHITKSKTKDFLVNLIQNNKVYKDFTQNLKSLQENQIQMRLTTYNFFIKHLDLVFK